VKLKLRLKSANDKRPTTTITNARMMSCVNCRENCKIQNVKVKKQNKKSSLYLSRASSYCPTKN
jgi:hypothetical protein